MDGYEEGQTVGGHWEPEVTWKTAPREFPFQVEQT